MTFMEMIEVLGVSNSFLTYHLDNLGELIGKTEDGKYKLSSFGEAAMSTLTKVEDIPSSTLHQSQQTKSKRTVGRSVAVALGIICIVLVACIGGAVLYYTSVVTSQDKTISFQNSQLSNLRNQNNQLLTWLDGNLTLLNQTQMWLSANITTYNQLQDEISSIHIYTTENSTVWVNNVTYPRYEEPTIIVNNETVSLVGIPSYGFSVPSAGYVSVVFSSNSTPTDVKIQSYLNGTINTLDWFGGSSGMIIFPVSSHTNYSVALDNPFGKSSTFTVTMTYYY